MATTTTSIFSVCRFNWNNCKVIQFSYACVITKSLFTMHKHADKKNSLYFGSSSEIEPCTSYISPTTSHTMVLNAKSSTIPTSYQIINLINKHFGAFKKVTMIYKSIYIDIKSSLKYIHQRGGGGGHGWIPPSLYKLGGCASNYYIGLHIPLFHIFHHLALQFASVQKYK